MKRSVRVLLPAIAVLTLIAGACSDDSGTPIVEDDGGDDDSAGTEADDLENVDPGGSSDGTGETVTEAGSGSASDGSTGAGGGTSGGSSAAVIDVVTGLDAFVLDLVGCSGFPDGPYDISGDDGANTVELTGTGAALDIVFTYANGDQLTVDGTDVAFVDPAGGTVQFVGDAVGPDGPELLIVEVDAC